MTRVDFYLLASTELEPRLTTVCRLAEKAVGLGERVHIHADDDDLLDSIDKGLWSFRAISFVPHVRLRGSDHVDDFSADPVHLASQQPALDRTLLINLAEDVPMFFSRFERTLEVLTDEPGIRASGRSRYRFYKERGYPLQHHQL